MHRHAIGATETSSPRHAIHHAITGFGCHSPRHRHATHFSPHHTPRHRHAMEGIRHTTSDDVSVAPAQDGQQPTPKGLVLKSWVYNNGHVAFWIVKSQPKWRCMVRKSPDSPICGHSWNPKPAKSETMSVRGMHTSDAIWHLKSVHSIVEPAKRT